MQITLNLAPGQMYRDAERQIHDAVFAQVRRVDLTAEIIGVPLRTLVDRRRAWRIAKERKHRQCQ